jgi:hypothetical protein
MLDGDFLEKVGIAVGAALLTWFLQQYRLARAEDVSLVNEHIKDIEKFRDAAQDYWLTVPKDAHHEQAGAAKVKAAHAATSLAYERIADICHGKGRSYRSLSIQLYMTATGGAFESERNAMDAPRAIEVYDHAAAVIHLLREVRRDLIGLKRLLPRLLVSACDFSAPGRHSETKR